MSLRGGKLIVVPADKPKFTLKQLLARVTEENLHDEVDTGSAVGGEAW
jgi:antitoxin component of MazEF toxin-antitoxin module